MDEIITTILKIFIVATCFYRAGENLKDNDMFIVFMLLAALFTMNL
jgi:hypothetical protein